MTHPIAYGVDSNCVLYSCVGGEGQPVEVCLGDETHLVPIIPLGIKAGWPRPFSLSLSPTQATVLCFVWFWFG